MDHDALPPGTRFGEFEILRVLGVGGFGIVYLAQDHSLEREVALKEYMPASLAARGLGPQITVRSSSFAETYAIGLRSFVNEARLLARFDHPSLVKVYRFWEDNATAYMVMPFLQGVTLRDTRRAMAHAPNEAWIRSVITPILSALELLHKEGVFHRDIAPDNILLPPDGPPVLLDFGAARRVISDRTQSLTAILKPSYAPIEQYAEMVQMRQGPWTDLYALGAVIHYLLFGAPPAPATARAVQDDADSIENRIVPGVSPLFLEAVAWMLSIRPNQRPQSGEELRAVLDGRAKIPPRGRPGITIPGATVSAAAAQAFESTRLADPATEEPKVTTAFMPTHQPTAHVAPPGAPRPPTFSPTSQMPTARPGTTQPPANVATPRTPPPQGQRDGGPPSRPATLPPPVTQMPARPAAAAPTTRPAPLAAPAATATATATRPAPLGAAGAAATPVKPAPSKLPLAMAAGAAFVVVAAVAGWQWMAKRDTAPVEPAAAASSPVLAAPAVVPPPTTLPAPVPAPAPAATVPVATAPAVTPIAPTSPAPVAAPTATATTTPVATPVATPLRPPASTASVPPAAAPTAVASPRPLPGTGTGMPRAGSTDPGAGPIRSGDGPAYGNANTSPPPLGNPSYITPPAVPGQANIASERARVAAAAAAAREAAAQRPAAPVQAGPMTAREDCGKRNFIALALCMEERCEQARFRNGEECVGILGRKSMRENR